MTLKELKVKLSRIAKDEEEPQLEARVLLSYLGFSPIVQITEGEQKVSKEIENKATLLMEKRASGYPMAYITGEKEFWGMAFHVSPSVLIPRPDTETLVETALKLYSGGKILDLCTGSGAIATALKKETKAPVFMSDISPEALAIAKENYERLTGENAQTRKGDLFAPWEEEKFSLIATNPPYLTQIWCDEVPPDVKKEPYIALFGHDEDGLGIIRRIVKEGKNHLENNGFLVIECDWRQCDSLSKLLDKEGYVGVNIVKDLAGKDRVVYGRYNR